MRITKALSVLFVPAAFALTAFPVAAVDVTVSVSPASSRGPCPVEFKFTGQVTLTKGKVGLFTYKWERSDGGVDTIVHPTVSYDGVHAALVTTTWTLGAAMPAFHPFHGWMKLHILTPQDKVSAPTNFTLDCGGGTNTGGPKHPNCDGKPDLVPLLHTPMDGWVAVKNIGTGNAAPSRLIIKCMKEGHTGPGGGCVDLPDSAITPPFFPTPDALGLNVPALPCGKEFPAPMAFWGSMKWPKGTYHFTATADATNAVVESNEGNNVTTSSMTR